jgi:hypothetical protein
MRQLESRSILLGAPAHEDFYPWLALWCHGLLSFLECTGRRILTDCGFFQTVTQVRAAACRVRAGVSTRG